jgi:hypothetical protein
MHQALFMQLQIDLFPNQSPSLRRIKRSRHDRLLFAAKGLR